MIRPSVKSVLQDALFFGKERKGYPKMKTKFTKSLSVLLVLLLTLCILPWAVGCEKGGGRTDATTTTASNSDDREVPNAKKYNFTFTVVHGDGTRKDFSISTDEEILGDALLAEGLISGDDDKYGLYVKVVDGETADYAADGAYWALYIGEEMAMSGVDATELTDGGIYSFVYTKG